MAGLHSIDTFSEKFGQGQRATLFEVHGGIGGGSDTFGDDKIFFIKSAQYPASTIGFIEVPFKGRKIKRPGDRTFAEWTLTVLQDEDDKMRQDFIQWMDAINDHTLITGQSQTSEGGAGLFPEWTIHALKQSGTAGEQTHAGGGIRLVRVFPTEVGTLEFNYETVDTFVEFTVTMQYDYWTSIGTGEGESGEGT